MKPYVLDLNSLHIYTYKVRMQGPSFQDNQYMQHFTDLESNAWDTVNLPLKTLLVV